MKKFLLASLLLVGATGMAVGCKENKDPSPNNAPTYEAQEFENVDLNEIYLSNDEIKIPVGDTHQLQISTNKSVVWRSENESIATVSDAGLVSALAKGRTEIYATVDDKVYSCIVVVDEKETYFAVTLDKADIKELSVGSKVQVNANVEARGMENYTLSWESSDESLLKVVSFDNSGCEIEAKAIGAATLTASYQGVKAVCNVEIVGVEAGEAATKVNAFDELSSVKPSWTNEYHQLYANNSNYVTNQKYIVPSVGDEEIAERAVSYKIDYKIGRLPSWFAGWGFNITVPKADLEDYRNFYGFNSLSVDVYLDLEAYASAATPHTRYIDVLTGIVDGVGQYTRCVITNKTWTTFTFDIDFIINNYDALKNTKVGQGYVMFATTTDTAYAQRPVGVKVAEGCPETVNGGDIGNNYTVYFGDVVFTKNLNKYPVISDIPDVVPDAEPEEPGADMSVITKEAIKASVDTAFHTVNGVANTRSIDYKYRITDDGAVRITGGTEVSDKVTTYSLAFTNSAKYTIPGFGIDLSAFSATDLQGYLDSGKTKLSVELYIQADGKSGANFRWGADEYRYFDVLNGFTEEGVGTYTRYTIKKNTWYTFTIDIATIIANYDAITNVANGKYVMFTLTDGNDNTTPPANVTSNAAGYQSLANKANNVGEVTVYFGKIEYVASGSEPTPSEPTPSEPTPSEPTPSASAVSMDAIKVSLDTPFHIPGDNQTRDTGYKYVTTTSDGVVSAYSGAGVADVTPTYQIAFTNSAKYYVPGFGIDLSAFSATDLQGYLDSGKTKLSVKLYIQADDKSGANFRWGADEYRYFDVLNGFTEEGVGTYTRYTIKKNTWYTFTFDIATIIANYDGFTGVAVGDYLMFTLTDGNDNAIPKENVTNNAEGYQELANKTNNVGAITVYFGEIAYVE